jgi:hypothetical protein
MDSPINMETFENAVHDWFTTATDLQTIWGQAGKTAPAYPYGVLQIIAGPVPASPQMEIRTSTNLARPAGSENEMLACVPCTFTVSCQTLVGGDDRWHPHGNARFYINKALGALGLPSYLATFKSAGIAVVRTAAVQDLSSVIEDAFVSRANMDIVFGMALNAIEYAGYIKKIHGTGTFDGSSQTIDREFGDLS